MEHQDTAKPTELTEAENKLQRIAKLLQLYEAILCVNLVGFFTDNLWKCVAFPIQAELLSLSHSSLCLLPVCAITQDDENPGSEGAASRLSNLRKFLRDVKQNRLENMKVLTPLEDILGMFKYDDPKSSSNRNNVKETRAAGLPPKMNTFMSEKKFHEVDKMAGVIAAVAKGANIKQVVDIGSGKGYLGQHLAQKHSLNVLGIDSSHTNSQGAKVRGQKMRKQLPRQNQKVCGGRRACADDSTSCSLLTSASGNDLKHDEALQQDVSRNKVGDTKDNELDTESLGRTVSSLNQSADKCQVQNCECNTAVGDSIDCKGLCQCSISNRTSSMTLENEEDRSVQSDKIVTAEFDDRPPLYKPVTAFVDTHTDMSKLLGDPSAQQEILLCGLHTCGDLSSSMLRLFAYNPTIRVICNVPCCYHLLTEEFEPNQVDQSCDGMRTGDAHYGFPMSSCLRLQETKIGGVARMVACMAADRLAQEKTLSTEKLFYRAVLQVILKEHYTIPTRQQKTGKLASKCGNFVEYTRRALKKMGYKEDELSDEVIREYYDTYKPEMKKLDAFHQLRATLAPSIEALIVLDKLVYLQEQESVKQAYLVRLFNPVTSPRCYAIIAAK